MKTNVEKVVEKLDKKLNKHNLSEVYKEMNHTILDRYMCKFTKKEADKQTEDELIEEIRKITEEVVNEVPFNLLANKMNEDDFCLQIAMISKFLMEN